MYRLHSPLRAHIESSLLVHFEVLLLKEMCQTLEVHFLCVNDTSQTSTSITTAIRRSWVFYKTDRLRAIRIYVRQWYNSRTFSCY